MELFHEYEDIFPKIVFRDERYCKLFRRNENISKAIFVPYQKETIKDKPEV